MTEQDILVLLQENNFGIISKTLFQGLMPDSPDELVVVKVYDASPSDLAWNGEYPVFQVAVRSASYVTAQTKCTNIHKLLHGICEQQINGTRYLLIQALQTPMYLSTDKSNRKIFVANFTVIKEI